MDHTDTRPQLVDIRGTMNQIPVKRTKVYGLIGEGRLTRVKVGARTFVTQESIDRFVAKLDRRRTQAA